MKRISPVCPPARPLLPSQLLPEGQLFICTFFKDFRPPLTRLSLCDAVLAHEDRLDSTLYVA